MPGNYDEYSRLTVPVVPLDRRTGITEVEEGYTEEQARLEATRCLECWINTIFEGNESDGTECILCGGCVDVCPENCLSLVPLRDVFIPEEVKDRLADADLPEREGSVMVKDETICIRCGLCAERCPAHTITMEAYEVFEGAEGGLT
jgi:ferredoxin